MHHHVLLRAPRARTGWTGEGQRGLTGGKGDMSERLWRLRVPDQRRPRPAARDLRAGRRRCRRCGDSIRRRFSGDPVSPDPPWEDRERTQGEAPFSLSVRRLPEQRSFLVAAGLKDVLVFLESSEFSETLIGSRRSLGSFGPGFLDFLRDVRFAFPSWRLRARPATGARDLEQGAREVPVKHCPIDPGQFADLERTPPVIRVRDHMTRPAVTIGWDDPAASAWSVMRARNIRHLPVIDADRRLVGSSRRPICERPSSGCRPARDGPNSRRRRRASSSGRS